MKPTKFTIKDFQAKYANDDACLVEIFQNRYGKIKDCPACHKRTNFYRVQGRKCWACQFCSHQLHPLSGTIFHKSETSLKTWFYAIFLFANSKNGVSAMEIKRQTGVTYKCAWRMANQIRKLFKPGKTPLKKTVEIDETFVGGKRHRDFGGHNKTPVIGAVERGAEVRAEVIKARYSSTIMPFVRQNVDITAKVYTDDWRAYRAGLPRMGYDHASINHSKHKYVRGMIHTNTIEGFWSQLKRGINGTYHHVSPYYLQNYVDEFCYRYNARFSPTPVFSSMISEVTKPS